MTDENDSGIDRRKLLKRVGSVGAASGLGAAASLSTVSAYMKEPVLDPGDGSYGGGGGGDGSGSNGCDSNGDYCLDGNVAQYAQEWTACAPQLTFSLGHPGRVNIGRGSSTYIDYPELQHKKPYLPAEDAWDKIIHEGWKDRGYAIRTERMSPYDEKDGVHEEKWDTEGPTRGDTVFVWAHGWQKGGLSLLPWQSGPGAVEATVGGRRQAGLAWDAIDYYTSIGELAEDNDSVHTVGFAWNSASATLNFNSAVGQAHRYGPRNFAPFLMDLADRVGPRGTIHIGAHSLGCWMTLEALAKTYYENATQLYSALDSVRFICAAVPESALNHDENWVNCENNGTLDYHGGTCIGSEPYQDEPYHKHALNIPNRVKNVYYPDDKVLTEKGTKEPFQRYLRYYGSSSDAVGASPVSPRGSIRWENVEATNVENHSNSYKHPAYASDAGCGQNVIWNEWEDVGRDCGGDGRNPGDRDRGDRNRDGDGSRDRDRTGGGGGGSRGGTIDRDEDRVRLR